MQMIPFASTRMAYSQLMDKHMIHMIHWMVWHRYTTYMRVLSLFVNMDRQLMSRYHQSRIMKPQYYPYMYHHDDLILSCDICPGQQLLVFPDLWTLSTMIDVNHLPPKTKIMTSTTTTKTKIQTYRDIMYGRINTLICTHSQIFQHWKSLKHITIIDPHRRYYKSQKSPRYHTYDLVTYMSTLYNCPLQIWSLIAS